MPIRDCGIDSPPISKGGGIPFTAIFAAGVGGKNSCKKISPPQGEGQGVGSSFSYMRLSSSAFLAWNSSGVSRPCWRRLSSWAIIAGISAGEGMPFDCILA